MAGGKGKVGAVGFCYGGGVVNMLATRWPELGAGVAAHDLAVQQHAARLNRLTLLPR